ncbi:MAG: DUF5615 family PIN-like protein [Planctomycetes bacterium]|nr:DUF5615 family PIN-like protein [Planctomycetota bacterium]
MLLYGNENFAAEAVERLRSLGHDVLTTHEAGQSRQRVPDDQVLKDATAAGRAVLTFNRRDFIALHRRGGRHAGIVVCTCDDDTSGLAERIDAALASAGTIAGRLVRVTKGGSTMEGPSPEVYDHG